MATNAASIAVAVVAVPFVSSLAESSFKLATKVPRLIANRVFLESGRCQQLLWEDVPDGSLHRCVEWGPQACRHDERLGSSGPEWEKSISQVFNVAWESPERPNRTVAKPEGLAMGQNYLKTDIRVLLAFAFMTATPRDGNSRHWILNDHFDMKQYPNGIDTYKIKGSFQRHLTKREVECLLDRYPPAYREIAPTKYGFDIPFPISSINDLRRAGWIVAMGMSPITNPSFDPPQDMFEVPIHTTQGPLWEGSAKRLVRVLQQTFAPCFPENDVIESTIAAIKYMIDEHTNSGAIHMLSPEARYATEDDSVVLTEVECRWILALFNDLRPLTTQEREMIEMRGILNEMCSLCFLGAQDLYTGRKNCRGEIQIDGMEDFQRALNKVGNEIYIRN